MLYFLLNDVRLTNNIILHFNVVYRLWKLRPVLYVEFWSRRMQFNLCNSIIYCLNCIRRDQNSTYKTGLIGQNDQKQLVTWMHLREPIKNGRFNQ